MKNKIFATMIILALLILASCSSETEEEEQQGDGEAITDTGTPIAVMRVDPANLSLQKGMSIQLISRYAQSQRTFDGERNGTRSIVIGNYYPDDEIIALGYEQYDWTETEASAIARKTAERQNEIRGVGTPYVDVPAPVYGPVKSTGGYTIDKHSTIQILLPAYWAAQKVTLESGLIWLSKKQLNDLKERDKIVADLSLFENRISDPMLTDAMGDSLTTLQIGVSKATKEGRINVLNAIENADHELLVDGKRSKVETIKVAGWYGEFLILNNPDNPIILKATFDPDTRMDENLQDLAALLSYEVTSIDTP